MQVPTFDEFVSREEQRVRRIIRFRLRRRSHEHEDVYQEILLALWKAWPRMDWEGGNPSGLYMIMASRFCRTWGKAMERRHKKTAHPNEVDAELMEESWSLREHDRKMRATAEGPPKWRPFMEDMLPEDQALARLAIEICRVPGLAVMPSPGWAFQMEQWMPATWDRRKVIALWRHRIDNARVSWNAGRTQNFAGKSTSHERRLLHAWTIKKLPGVLRKIREGRLPPLRHEDAPRELMAWVGRLRDLAREVKYKGYGRHRDKDGRRLSHVAMAMQALPPWLRDPHVDPWRACIWFRKHWKGVSSWLRENGWTAWEDRKRVMASKRTMEWQERNAKRVKAYRATPAYKKSHCLASQRCRDARRDAYREADRLRKARKRASRLA